MTGQRGMVGADHEAHRAHAGRAGIACVPRDECREHVARQFAGLVARQRIDEQQRTRHERGVDALAQCTQQIGGRHVRRDNERDEARDRLAVRVARARRVVVGHEEHAVRDARYRVELVVQVAERGSLAGDVDEIGLASVHQEMGVVERFERVAHRHRRLDVAARHPERRPAVVVARAGARFEPNLRKELPGRTLGGPPRRDLAGLGAAVDFDQRRGQPRLGFARELLRKRRGGGQHERCRRQRVPGRQQRAQMDRRRDQHARLRHRVEFRADVDRIERLPVAEREAADQCEQHGRFESVHVLRRHRADQRARARASADDAQACCRRAHAFDEKPPGLAVRHRRAGRARREHVCHDPRGVDQRHVDRRAVAREAGFAVHRGLGVAEARQVDRAVGRIVHADRIGRERRELPHHLRRMRRRQQADPAGDERRAQADREAVAVAAHVEHVAACRQRGGHARDIREKRAHRHGHAVAPGDGLVGRRMEHQRITRHDFSKNESGMPVTRACRASRNANSWFMAPAPRASASTAGTRESRRACPRAPRPATRNAGMHAPRRT